MKLAVISFTKAGTALCRSLTEQLNGRGHSCIGYAPEKYLRGGAAERTGDGVLRARREPLDVWTCRNFSEADGLIFVGAAGIAVRAIAPYVRDKMTDPAVVVVDESARFAISLLSGHVGGANELTREVASLTGAQPVITTASDVRRKVAVDVWAKEHGLVLGSREFAKQAEAAILDGGRLGFFCDEELRPLLPGLNPECLPEEFVWESRQEHNLRLTVRSSGAAEAAGAGTQKAVPDLCLIPRLLVLGIGCRRGVSCQTVRRQVEQAFQGAGLDLRSVCRIASIDLKKEEPGIRELAEELGVPFVTFSARELEQVEGPVEESAFVRAVTGTGNVCERAALLAAGAGSQLAVKKYAADGVTVAAAWRSRQWQR